MDDVVAVAEKIAREAHSGQTDKSGQPYIGHPERIANSLKDSNAKAVAWLHDVLEDTDFPEAKLREVLPKEVVDAVAVMTHPRNEPYVDYILRVSRNVLSTKVKLADIADNTKPSRMVKLPMKDQIRMKKKYANALKILSTDLDKFRRN